MRILFAAFLAALTLPACGQAVEWALVVKEGRMHLLSPRGAPVVRVNVFATRGPGEGMHSFVQLEEKPEGLVIEADLDELGTPYWVNLTLTARAGGAGGD